MIKVGFGETPKPTREARVRPRICRRVLPVRLRRLGGFCGFARFWRCTACGSAAGKILVGDREYIMFNE